jgi:hypothetical protein
MFRLSALLVSLLFAHNSFAQCPSSTHQINADGTVHDPKTGLSWMSCSFGTTWENKTCTGNVEKQNWSSAKRFVTEVNEEKGFAGHNDWRLPTSEELNSLVDVSCINPALNPDSFPATPPSGYWTADEDPYYDQGATLVFFLHGKSYLANKQQNWYTRLVRK